MLGPIVQSLRMNRCIRGVLKHRSIKTYLSGVWYYQIKSGYPDPFQGPAMPHLEYVMKGVKCHQAKAGAGAWARLPITPELLRGLKGVWSPSGSAGDTKLIWAACCLCFFRFFACRGDDGTQRQGV